MLFTTAESGYGFPTMDGFVKWHFSNPPEPAKPLGRHPGQHTKEVVAHAIVRQSRWVVVCPWCPSVQYAHTVDKRFFCIDCGSAPVGGKWVTVQWPENPAEIERLLSVRADPTTRNWEWGESVSGLVVENFDHGAGALVKP